MNDEPKRGRYVADGVFVTEGGMEEMLEHHRKCCEEGKAPPVYISRSIYDDLCGVLSAEVDADEPLFIHDLGGES